MRIVILGLILIMLAVVSPTEAALELRLTTRLSEQLPFLYPDMRLEVVNASQDVVLFPGNAFRVLLSLEDEEGWRECRPLVVPRRRPLSSIEWQEISPGGVFGVGIPGSRCAEGKGTWFEWANQPGAHRVKAVLTTGAQEVGVPENAFDGVLESNVLEFRVKEPVGIDAEVVAWAKGSPMKVELLGEFPASEYAAFFVYGKSRRIDKVEPGETRSLIERGLYPGPNSVPHETGWKSVSSEAYARWQIEWGQRVLREHPEFPFRDEIEVAVALARMSVGERKEALTTLKGIVDKGKVDTAAWVKVFLESEPQSN